ncbi:bifunctional 2-polyprenyl-6-hydroxyphenol methylase/3-demethylubiquinol 3-O-methyltransferase UbiG [Frankia sp. R82]|uniref:class I SAM-dependent methyltransferase n=1 Tax=Frankia sp. R82 TaxID=2950553 RepID=UPI002044310E|nr:class I SAM-dependent methyltransferase [Frankia sp. R82]MCM3884719.1 class I SAM-dependent methyltransferase [Frankia sp. R82]
MPDSPSTVGGRFRSLAGYALATAGAQNFLGARWVPVLLATTPARYRRRMALRLLSYSPHYFQPGEHDRNAAAERNLRSRQALADDLLGRYLLADDDVLDVGCGPGYLAVAVAPRVHALTAVDVSRGVLACARVLNPAPNLEYLLAEEFHRSGRDVDVVYCIAVVQHLTDEVVAAALRDWHAALRPGGRLLLHVVIDDPAWRTEQQWRAERGLAGRLRLRFALNCFGRSADQVRRLVTEAGFGDLELIPMSTLVDVEDDVTGQHLVVARRHDVAPPWPPTPSRGLAVHVPAQVMPPGQLDTLERLGPDPLDR